MQNLTAVQNKISTYALFFALAVMMVVPAVMESLDISSLLNVNKIFEYANLMLSALVPVILIGLGFALANYIIRFVQRLFNNLG